MAASNRIYSLSLGSQTVRLAQFHADKNGGLVLAKYQTTELLADPAADATRISQTNLAVHELTGALQTGKADVNYAVPGQSIFVRCIKLPSVGAEKVEQIVAFEAQQNIPFPIDEVVWDYQILTADTAAGSQMEVVLAAIRSDLLEDLNQAVESVGLKTNVVDVAPMALCNAFRYNYSDLGGCSLLIDIGARTTNLIFVDGHKIYSRSIANGGNTITAAIAKDFKESFAQAEERKKQQAFVSLGGAYAEPDDPDVARLAKLTRNIMTRLHAEISRSISYYRSQPGAKAPERVFLCGGGAATPYMREFFHEKLALPIEFFNPLRNVAVDPGIDANKIGKEAYLLGELVGLALRSGNTCPVEINLRPSSVAKAREMSARKPFLILAGVALVATLGSWYFYYQKAATLTEDVIAGINPKKNALEALNTKFNAAENERKIRQQAAAPLLEAMAERDYWLKLVDDINSRLPQRYIWVTSLSVDEDKAATTPGRTPNRQRAAQEADADTTPRRRLILKGYYLYNPESANISDRFAKALSESPFLEFDPKDTAFTGTRVSQTETEWNFPFEYRLPLKDLPQP